MVVSDAVRNQIVGMSLAGSKAAKIAHTLQVHKSTVSRILKLHEKTGTVERKMSSGRPRKLTERDERSLVSVVNKNRRATLTDIANSLPTKVSKNTVRRALHRLRIFSRFAVIKPYLTARHKKARLEFAKKYLHWTADDWRKVVWTDESSFEIGKNYRKVRVWRTKSEKYSNSCIAPSFKSGRTSVMVWGAFSGSSMSNLVVIPPGQNKSVDFVEIVYKGELLGFLGQTSNAFLMEDGAPIHRAQVAKAWREQHSLETFKWPAQSPDLNPIENVWSLLKHAVHVRRIRPRTPTDMITALNEEWKNTSKGYLDKLIDDMPERMKAVVKNKGGSTRW